MSVLTWAKAPPESIATLASNKVSEILIDDCLM